MMTEQEYIDATNLAKIRAAKVVVYDALSTNEEEEQIQKQVALLLRQWEGILTRKIKVKT